MKRLVFRMWKDHLVNKLLSSNMLSYLRMHVALGCSRLTKIVIHKDFNNLDGILNKFQLNIKNLCHTLIKSKKIL